MPGATRGRGVALCALAAALFCMPAHAAAEPAAKSGVSKTHVKRCGAVGKPKAAGRAKQRCIARLTSAKRDRTKPVVAFKAPVSGMTVSGTLRDAACEATATDNRGVDRVEFSVDGRALNVERGVPYNCVWDTTGVAAGPHTLTARAVDTSGNAASASVTVSVATPPSEPAPAPAPDPSPVPAPSPAPAPSPLVGISATLRWMGQADIAATLDKLKPAGVKVVREDWHWNLVEPVRGTYDWTRYDRLMRETALRNVQVIAIPNNAPSWATASSITPPTSGEALTGYIAFVRAAIARYGSQGTFWAANPTLPKVPVTMWDIWNEPWGTWAWNTPDGAAYARFFKAVVQAARPLDPAARFMADVETRTVGTTTWTPFLHQMFAAVPDLGAYMDMVSHHPYTDAASPTGCSAYSPSRGVTEDYKATLYQFCRVRDVRAILDAYGAANTRIWMTEIGYTTAPSASRTVTETQQAQHVRDVFRLLREWDVVDGVLWFTYKDSAGGDPTDREQWFGLVRRDGTPKPAWPVFVEEANAGL
jgi:hypothetical protein